MPRFIAKFYSTGSWLVVDSKDNQELFGDQLPATELEAKTCARAANIAARKVEIEATEKLILQLQKSLKHL